MNDTKFKPSLIINSLLGDELSRDSENFLSFLKAYYEWLQSTKLTLSDINGNFQKNEIIVADSGASGIIQEVGEVGSNYLNIKSTSKKLFLNNESIQGQTSNAKATILSVKDNVVKASGNFSDYRSIEYSVDQYYEYLREELYSSIPSTYLGNKRLLAKNFRDYFESKGNEESYRFLFKILYNEPIEFYYPGQDILRISDGKFYNPRILRVAVNPRIFEFLDKTIRGQTSDAIGNVVDIKTFFIGSIEIAEFIVSLVSGTFSAYEDIVDITDETLVTSTYGIISDFNIIDGGSGYVVGDPIIISGDGAEAQAFVASIQDSPITAISINATGYGYRLGTTAIVNNSGTGGDGFVLRVGKIKNPYQAGGFTVGEIEKLSIINRGSGYIKKPTITLQDVEVSAIGMLTEKLVTILDAGSDYGVGNTLIISGGSGANATGQIASVVETTTYDLLFEDEFRMLADGSYEDIIKNEDWDVVGPIARIEFTNFGDGYTLDDLPTITVNTTTGSNASFNVIGIQGQSANVTVDVSNNIAGIGAIRDTIITNFGINYSNANADVSASGDQNAILEPIIAGLGIKEGTWLGDDGKLNIKIIQDSFFYQDFSYAIRSALTFNSYKDTLLKTVHPAGFQPFGQILLTSFFSLSPNFVTLIESANPEIDVLLLQIRNFFSVAVSNPFDGSRIEVDIPRIQFNVEIANTDSRFIEIEINPELDLSFTAERQVVITPTYQVLDELIDSDRQVVITPTYEIIDEQIITDRQFVLQHGFEDLDVSSNFDENEYVIKPTYQVLDELIDSDRQVIITPTYEIIDEQIVLDNQFVLQHGFEDLDVSSNFDENEYVIKPESDNIIVDVNLNYREIIVEKSTELDLIIDSDKQVVITPTYEIIDEQIVTDSRFIEIKINPELDLIIDSDKQVVITPTYEIIDEQIVLDNEFVINSKYDSLNLESDFGTTKLNYQVIPKISVPIQSPDASVGLTFNLKLEGPKYSSFQFKDVKIGNINQYDPNNSELLLNFADVRFDDYIAPPTKISLSIVNDQIVVPINSVSFDYNPIKKIISFGDTALINIYDDFNVLRKIETSTSVVGPINTNIYFSFTSENIDLITNVVNQKYEVVIDKLSFSLQPNFITIIQTDLLEIDKILLQISNFFSTSVVGLSNKYIIQSTFEDLDVSSNFNTNKYLIKPKYQVLNESIDSERQVVIKSKHDTLNLSSNTITQSFGLFQDATISQFSFEPILTFANFAFEDPISFGSAIKNVKISGTVTVSGNTIIGTNTLFAEEFTANEFVIVDNSEKFIINNISNNSFMTINLPASGSYTDVFAYKENL